MLFKILGRVLGTIATIMVIGVIRLVLFAMIAHPKPQAGIGGVHAYGDQGTATLAAADHSGWIVFDTADPATGLRTRHARLTGASSLPGPNVLELTRAGAEQHVALLLTRASPCAAVSSIGASFDRHETQVAVKPAGDGPGCNLEFLDDVAALQSLRDADVLTVHAPHGQDVTFEVGGLAWD